MCSLTLGAIVVLNAQFGCDAPASTAPPPAEPAKKDEAQPAKSAEPAKAAEPEAKVEPPADPAEPTPSNDPVANPPAKSNAEPEPVYMPASKSGGDFGRMPFPGQAPAQQQQQAPQ